MDQSQPPQQEAPVAQPTVAPIKKKLSQNTINLSITLLIGILLAANVLFPDAASQWEQLRFFVVFKTNVDLLAKLLPLRVGLAFVFFWYSIDNFIHPQIFNNLANTVLKKMSIAKQNIPLYPLAYLQAGVEFLVGISLVTGIFLDVGSLLGSLLLCAVLFAYQEGLGSLLVRDIGLLGGTLTLFLITIALRV